MEREEILALCASNPEVVAYIESLESQVKELSTRCEITLFNFYTVLKYSTRCSMISFELKNAFLKLFRSNSLVKGYKP